jgi:hypothetical protein
MLRIIPHSVGSYVIQLVGCLCSRCQTAERIPGQRWCRECLTAYQRQRRHQARSTRDTFHHHGDALLSGRRPHPQPHQNGGAKLGVHLDASSVIQPAALAPPADVRGGYTTKPRLSRIEGSSLKPAFTPVIDQSKCPPVPRDGSVACSKCGWPTFTRNAKSPRLRLSLGEVT